MLKITLQKSLKILIQINLMTMIWSSVFACEKLVAIRFWDLYLNHALKVKNFPPHGKKQMLPQFIKNDKQLIKNYRLISLLPVCGKILERLIYNKMFKFFTENELISHNQPGLKAGEYHSRYLSITWWLSPDKRRLSWYIRSIW